MEMDDGLFQIITMVLLGVTLLVLVLTLLNLGKLGKKVDELVARAPGDERDPSSQRDQQHHEEPARTDEHGGGDEWQRPEPEPAGQRAAQTSQYPVASHQEHAPAQEASAPATEEASAAPQDRGSTLITGAPAAQEEPRQAEPLQQDPAPTQQDPEPVQQQEPAPARSQTTGFEDAPEEQPFERDGRWWFKRGDEILVYDEQTGGWQPAPAEATGGGATGPAMAEDGTGGWQQQQAGQEAQQPEDEAQGSFWKCPSCGAVNGSTATACRMCFTPR